MNHVTSLLAKKLQEVSDREIEVSILEVYDLNSSHPGASKITVTYILGTDTHTIDPVEDKRRTAKDPMMFDHVGVIKAGFDLEFHKLQIIVKDHDNIIGKKDLRVNKLSRIPEQKWYKLYPSGHIRIELVAVNWGKIPKPDSKQNTDLANFFLTRSLGKVKRTFVREYKKPDIKRELPHIAAGTFGIVYKGSVRDKRGIVAIKDIKVKDYTTFEAWKKEVDFMSGAFNKYVVEVFGFCCSPQLVTIVMEYLEKGTLFDILHGKKTSDSDKISLLDRLRMARHCTLAVAFLHSRNVLHRDVKSLNILVSADNVCKLSDFGSAKLIGNAQLEYYTAGKGTPFWMAPEVMAGHAYNLSADVYSLGIVLFELFEYKLPDYDHDIKSITLETYDFTSAGIVLPMLDRRHHLRPTAMQISQIIETILMDIAIKLNLPIPQEISLSGNENSTTVGLSLNPEDNSAETLDAIFSPEKLSGISSSDLRAHVLHEITEFTNRTFHNDSAVTEDDDGDIVDDSNNKDDNNKTERNERKSISRKRSMSQESLGLTLELSDSTSEKKNQEIQNEEQQQRQSRRRLLTRTLSSPNTLDSDSHNKQLQQSQSQSRSQFNSQSQSQSQSQSLQTIKIPQQNQQQESLQPPRPQQNALSVSQPFGSKTKPQSPRPPRPHAVAPQLPQKNLGGSSINFVGVPTTVSTTTTTTLTTTTTITTIIAPPRPTSTPGVGWTVVPRTNGSNSPPTNFTGPSTHTNLATSTTTISTTSASTTTTTSPSTKSFTNPAIPIGIANSISATTVLHNSPRSLTPITGKSMQENH